MLAFSVGDPIETGQPSASGTAGKCSQMSRKRPRKESNTGSVIDLNLPAQAHAVNAYNYK